MTSPIEMELQTTMMTMVEILLYWNEKVDSLYNWTLRKISITSKNASNENWSELNFLQKPQGHIFLSSPGVELGAPKIAMLEIL